MEYLIVASIGCSGMGWCQIECVEIDTVVGIGWGGIGLGA